MTFSGALVCPKYTSYDFSFTSLDGQTLTDLNDFITPSQACIKPVEQIKPQEVAKPGGASVSTCGFFQFFVYSINFLQTEIQIDSSGLYYEVSVNGLSQNKANGIEAKKLEQAQISLNDCLACRYVSTPALSYGLC
jgi:hypothetical protein